MNFETINLNENIKIYKKNLEHNFDKTELVEFCNDVFKNEKIFSNIDAYPFPDRAPKDVELIIKECINFCRKVSILNNKNGGDKAVMNTWINRVRKRNPVQTNFVSKIEENKFHSHKKLNTNSNNFIPDWTFVYYLQMPNNLNGNDAVLSFKDEKSNEIFNILPEENTILVFEGDLLHSPNDAPNSDHDRVVFAGVVTFFNKKTTKTFL